MTATTELIGTDAMFEKAQDVEGAAGERLRQKLEDLQEAEAKLEAVQDRVTDLESSPQTTDVQDLLTANATAQLAESQVDIAREAQLVATADRTVAVGKRKQTETVLLNAAIQDQLEIIEGTVQTAIDDLASQAEELRRLENRRRSVSLKPDPYYGVPRLDALKGWLSARNKWTTRKARDAAVPPGGYSVRIVDTRDDPIKNELRTQEFGPTLHIPRGGSVEAKIPADMLLRLQRRPDLEVQLLESEAQVAD